LQRVCSRTAGRLWVALTCDFDELARLLGCATNAELDSVVYGSARPSSETFRKLWALTVPDNLVGVLLARVDELQAKVDSLEKAAASVGQAGRHDATA
jgi:hypothetical protein